MSSITNISGNKPYGVLAMSCALGGSGAVAGTEQGSSREEQAD
ncbi:MAG: hypothetical protein ACOH12_10915 [Parvibaculaceae bacterium]